MRTFSEEEARAVFAPAAREAPAEPRLDLNLLDDEPSAERTATRTRTR